MSVQQDLTPSLSMSPGPARIRSAIVDEVVACPEPLHVQKVAAELELAEAELKAARLKYAYIEAKEEAEKKNKYGDSGTLDSPLRLN
jgi:hypothetical protein